VPQVHPINSSGNTLMCLKNLERMGEYRPAGEST